MKHFLLFIFLFFAYIGYAQNEVALIDKKPSTNGTPNRNEVPLPKVTYDDNTVCIEDSLEREVAIVIKNTEGEIVHQSFSFLSPSTTVVYSAPEGTYDLYTIDLYINDEEYYGYFE